jgi:hypothetical protein
VDEQGTTRGQVAERGRAAGGAQDLRGGGVQREKNREKLGFGEDEGDLVVKMQKTQGPHCKGLATFKPVLK